MNVLGIHIGHDSSVTLVQNGKIIASAAEERFVGIKHYGGMPFKSLDSCFAMTGLSMELIDKVAYTGHLNDKRLNQFFELPLSASYSLKNGEMSLKAKVKSKIKDLILTYASVPDYFPTFKMHKNCSIEYVPHHKAHAASAYYTSGNKKNKTLIITSDGAGEDGFSLTVWVGENGKLINKKSYPTSNSYGFFYGVVTEALGWWIGDGEGTTMGLAPYGDPAKVPDNVFDKILPRFEGGRFIAEIDFGVIDSFLYQDTYHWHFSCVDIVKELIQIYGRENIAAKAQEILELEMVKFIRYWQDITGCDYCATAGGVFLNVKLNQKVINTDIFKDYYIYPDSGDAGISAGAALHSYLSPNPEKMISLDRIRDVYWGAEYKDEEIKAILDERGLVYRKSDNIAADIGRELADGKIVAWFQGRMECGPRALGGRSILFDARKAENKDVINSSVKFREPFRPFCPSMKAECAGKYLKNADRIERYMITAYDILPEKREDIAAVTHVDGTCRPQMVEKEIYPRFWNLLDEYEKLTGVGVLMNTSFNIKGSPIVCNPRDAIKCFYDTGIQVLALGSFVLKK